MAKYWVSVIKYAGVEVEANSSEEALNKAESVPESEYEYFPNMEGWLFENAELVEDQEE